MDYGFELNWYDLSPELQAQKIDEVITYNFEHNEYDNEDSEIDLYDVLEDEDIRKDTERYIQSHFPVYF